MNKVNNDKIDNTNFIILMSIYTLSIVSAFFLINK